jgi:hypothetical protein
MKALCFTMGLIYLRGWGFLFVIDSDPWLFADLPQKYSSGLIFNKFDRQAELTSKGKCLPHGT